uniref:Uncharacterized protein n=1 Tax=Panagrolaimus sp. JU765 TaxID=591449 RepID=A0AC34QLF2_9BILA
MIFKAKLERVLGCTASSSSFCHDPTTGIVAYAAGSTVVILGKHNSQSHLVNNSKNNITCLAFSPDGKYLATGEFGAEPMVRVWELPREGPFHAKQVVELKGHTFGINCVRFTHDSRRLISIGNQHDRSIVVWHWKEQRKGAENRLTSQVNAMDISYDGNNFVTVGVRHVKFWMLGETDRALNGRSAILAEQRTNTFLAVCCAPGNKTFAITNTRILVEFLDKKIVNTFEMKGDVPQSITLGPSNYLLVGFSNGLIRAIHSETFEVTHLHGKPHYHYHDIADATDFSNFYKNIAQNSAVANFPDVRGITFFKKTNTLTVLYSDRSIYQWSLTNDFRQSLIHGYRNHVGAIMDLEMVPMNYPWLAAGTFITAGIDGTIRFWYLEKQQEVSDSVLSSNILSPELKKILYLGDDEKLFKDVCDTNQGIMFNDSLDSTSGAKCVRLKPDGTHLAAGFRDGNLGIFDLTSTEFKKLAWIEAHDGEILCAEYTDPRMYNSHCILATGGRDRLIHLFDADNNYSHIQSVEDHSSSVNSIKFIPFSGGYEMFTCGTDKLVVIRKLTIDGDISLERTNQFNSPSGLNYLTTCPDNSLIFACGRDRLIHLFDADNNYSHIQSVEDHSSSVNSIKFIPFPGGYEMFTYRQLRTYSSKGKVIKQVKGTLCEEGTLTKLALDPSGTYAATVCSDRYVYLIDVATGECAAVLNGQADCVTAIAFTPDCRRLLVVSHSGCVFVWRLSNMLTKKMTTKLGRPEQVERCTTPDSVIESGSDSASVNGKKDRSGLTASGSEFGSLTSLPIINDDDLDSGVGGARHPVIDLDAKDSNHFEIRRLPQEVVRRSSSSYLNAPETDFDRSSPVPESEMSQLLSHSQPNAYVSSRSMSNLHRSNASPQRIRRKWNDLNLTSSPSPVNSPDYSNPPAHVPQSHVYQQPMQPLKSPGIGTHVYQQPMQPLKSPGIGTSISLHGLRNYTHYESPVATSTPKNTFAPVPLRHPNQNYDYRPGQFDNSFDRSNSSRNSLTKKFMNLGASSAESKAVWTPPKYDTNRRPSGLFNGSLNGGNAIQRR